ncbi:hypothetical protein [Kouleothrix sp.]|uniref:hypothetical protein n=1 Tax=Kouleothrix sp. TaxID=2779161 RepID=UPI00391A8A78
MPPHTRSQRRRQGARQQPRPAVSAEAPEYTGTTTSLDAPELPAPPVPPAARPARNARRVISRVAPEPVDYTADYGAARRDLRWIAIWSILLFVAMIALKFSGIV